MLKQAFFLLVLLSVSLPVMTAQELNDTWAVPCTVPPPSPQRAGLFSSLWQVIVSVGSAVIDATKTAIGEINNYQLLAECAIGFTEAEVAAQALKDCVKSYGTAVAKQILEDEVNGVKTVTGGTFNFDLQCYTIQYPSGNTGTNAVYAFQSNSNIYSGLQLFTATKTTTTVNNPVGTQPAFLFSSSELTTFINSPNSYLANLVPTGYTIQTSVLPGTMSSNGNDLLFQNIYFEQGNCPSGRCYAPAGWLVCVPVKNMGTAQLNYCSGSNCGSTDSSTKTSCIDFNHEVNDLDCFQTYEDDTTPRDGFEFVFEQGAINVTRKHILHNQYAEDYNVGDMVYHQKVLAKKSVVIPKVKNYFCVKQYMWVNGVKVGSNDEESLLRDVILSRK